MTSVSPTRCKRGEGGFTLVELLVVMIIIGILASIAVPVFLNQRIKAQDTATKADVSTLAKEIQSFYVEGAGQVPVTYDSAVGQYLVNGVRVGAKSQKTISDPTLTFANPASPNLSWCVSLSNSAAKNQAWRYSATGGLASGSC